MELQDSLTVFYIPFEIAENADRINVFEHSENWVRQTDLKVTEGYLYPYVSQFMSGDCTFGDGASIYKIKDNAVHSFLNNKQYVVLCDAKKDIKYTFRFCYAKHLHSPHIIIYPHCPVGILMFGVELKNTDGNLTLDNLAEFNYYLHKFDHQQPSIFTDESTDKKRILAEKLYGGSDKGITMLDLCKKMLSEQVCQKINFLDPNRMHLFTYLQTTGVDDANMMEFKETLVRIASGQTQMYQVMAKPQPTELFRNIYMCSRSEGGVMATIITPENNTSFLKDYKQNKFVVEYLWIYTFLIMQYYAMIRFTNRLYHPIGYQDLDKTISQLWQIKKHIFVSISRHTHINKFYNTVVHNLGIRALLKMLDENYNYMNNQNQTKIVEQTNTIITFLTVSQVVFAVFSFLSISVSWSVSKELIYFVLLALGMAWVAVCIWMMIRHWSLIYGCFRFGKGKLRL